jgi:hypothetical protein
MERGGRPFLRTVRRQALRWRWLLRLRCFRAMTQAREGRSEGGDVTRLKFGVTLFQVLQHSIKFITHDLSLPKKSHTAKSC